MIIAIANVSVTLPCLAVLCALLLIGIAVISVLLIKSKLKYDKIIKCGDYNNQNDTLSADSVKNDSIDSPVENSKSEEVDGNEA